MSRSLKLKESVGGVPRKIQNFEIGYQFSPNIFDLSFLHFQRSSQDETRTLEVYQ